MSDQKNLEIMRHSLSHVMAAAIAEFFGTTTQFGVGPAVDDGFYYDVMLSGGKTITQDDLTKIEKKMRGIISRGLKIEVSEKSRKDALEWADESGQRFKKELIEELPAGEEIHFYSIGSFTDLCRGPHVADTSKVGAFKLTKLAGAYWRGDEKREQMQRVYGVAFETEEELADYLKMQEEARDRDHRKLGRELDLFCFSDLVGAGLPMFTPRGTVLRDMVGEYSLSVRKARGFMKIWTPHITKMDLYKTSGHYDKFGEELFIVNSQVTGDKFAMKPMNCPHEVMVFASRPRTYREMPVRYMEITTDYRDEKTGELGGLNRVRALTQDDSHVLCRREQIKDEVGVLVGVVREVYGTFGMDKLRVRLSYRDDSDGYLGDPKWWEIAQKQIKELAEENELEYYEAEGEAAFYGPKLDFMAQDALGREHQVATIQLDFVQPARFGLEFVNEKGEKETPVMLHHATLGSIERFLSVYIEHTGGWFPMWCAPEMVRVVTVNDSDEVVEYVSRVEEVLRGVELDKPLRHNELRYTVDRRNESLGKKIREASAMKVPVVIVVGPRDVEGGSVSVRLRDREETVELEGLAEYLRGL